MYQSPAATPSGIRSNTPAAAAAAAVVTRSTPSAPSPRRRSQSAATAAGVSDSLPSGSGSSTKSFSVPCPLANFTSSGYVSPYPQRVFDSVGARSVEPGDAVVTAKPRPLTADVAARSEERRFARRRSVTAVVEIGDHLCVSQRPGRRHTLPQPAVQQCADLPHEPVGEHRVGPPSEAL